VKFGSDLDASTREVLEKGARNVEILKQNQYSPIPVEEQIAILFCGTRGLLMQVPVERIRGFETAFIQTLRSSHADLLQGLKKGSLDEAVVRKLTEVAGSVAGSFKGS